MAVRRMGGARAMDEWRTQRSVPLGNEWRAATPAPLPVVRPSGRAEADVGAKPCFAQYSMKDDDAWHRPEDGSPKGLPYEIQAHP
jgi:hypothetical protein